MFEPMPTDRQSPTLSKRNGPNAGYALRPSYFWMPQVGHGIRTDAIIFREPALFSFAHCPNFQWRLRPQLAGARARAVVSWTPCGGNASGIRNKRSHSAE